MNSYVTLITATSYNQYCWTQLTLSHQAMIVRYCLELCICRLYEVHVTLHYSVHLTLHYTVHVQHTRQSL